MFTQNALTFSQVVPREYQSSEYYHGMQRRRRAAVSVADPTDMSITTLEDSSDFTKGLTTEEIARLNQRKTLSSPSERIGLFSFHKRHLNLKLPFRHRGKKDREKMTSPDKESRSSTPTRHRKLSSGSFRSTGSKKAGQCATSV